jgi:hypothetical protein
MSRSRKKNPFSWYNSDSAKQDKCMCNRMLRRISKQHINQDEEYLFSEKEVKKKLKINIPYKTTGHYLSNSYKDYLK